MTQETMEGLATFFADIWSIFTSIPVPGTNLNFGQLWTGALFALAIVGFLRSVLGNGVVDLDTDYYDKRHFYNMKDMHWKY